MANTSSRDRSERLWPRTLRGFVFAGGEGGWWARWDACGTHFAPYARVESAGARVREGSEAGMARQTGPTAARVAMYGSELYR